MTAAEVHVVVPAHDEAALVGACVASVADALEHLRATYGVRGRMLLVADRCTDGTERAAARLGLPGNVLTTLPVVAGCVGRARDLGVQHALATATLAADEVWVAMTDADSTVPRDWLTAQVEAWRAGHELWVGRVRPDPAGLTPAVLSAWEARHVSPDLLHVHGANLGFTAATYDRAGGFEAIPAHEDVRFVEAAVAAGVPWCVGGAVVQTSARTAGRAPEGFAGYLSALVAELDSA